MSEKPRDPSLQVSLSLEKNPLELESREKQTTTNENNIALAFAALKAEIRELQRRMEYLESEHESMNEVLHNIRKNIK